MYDADIKRSATLSSPADGGARRRELEHRFTESAVPAGAFTQRSRLAHRALAELAKRLWQRRGAARHT
eukprot:CAMPEP_0185462818 /NCGR_PEP_ID=MMETSP1365-20130426/93434_1 /TAXON_ID=38817 /ORGANISM="Gephyrocapsa oceanica, Strain RCC1303" /LENGTH=67 /DNA_ID=CAMNT_0028069511 /DNA_START=8 /DNA_END=207 /DNA_ORIENTATION=+